uniref:Uncharacterized protein n=1 Tax=virus sp. ctmTa7 TaxID=2828255 RepID=A0A8S5RBK1_9VIRU|nr:MAG TPA: hypothetical protein [virus sp. ctmTa7]DAU18399.1 MAG TPA: hypothetical protein [Bacteriophage sp.]
MIFYIIITIIHKEYVYLLDSWSYYNYKNQGG